MDGLHFLAVRFGGFRVPILNNTSNFSCLLQDRLTLAFHRSWLDGYVAHWLVCLLACLPVCLPNKDADMTVVRLAF